MSEKKNDEFQSIADNKYVTFIQANDRIVLRHAQNGTPISLKQCLKEQFLLQNTDHKNTTVETTDIPFLTVHPHSANDQCYRILDNINLTQCILSEHTYFCLIYAEEAQETAQKHSAFYVAIRAPDQLYGLCTDYEFHPFAASKTSHTLLPCHLEILPSELDIKGLSRSVETPPLPVIRAKKTQSKSYFITNETQNDAFVIVFVVLIVLISISGITYLGYLLWKYMRPRFKKEPQKTETNDKPSSSSQRNLEQMNFITQGEGTLG